MLKILYIVNKNLVFDKREVYRPTFIIGLSAKLYGRVISKLSSYWVASSYWDAIVTDYLIVTHICFLINNVISVYISAKKE